MCRVMASAFFGSHHWIPAFAGMTAKLTCGVRHPLLSSFPRRREFIAFVAATNSVPKVAHAGEDHGDVVFVGGGNDFLVAHGAAGLNHRGDTGFTGIV